MFSKELEEVIEAALADGVLTDKERAVLHKRAAAEGVDPDELDVVIDGRLAKAKKQEDWLKPAPPSTLMSNKVGDVKKCPNCGANYEPGTKKCPECGHVFQNVGIVSSFKKFTEGLNKISDEKDRANYINNYPVPSEKDDLLEFITSMEARAKTLEAEEADPYKAKFREAINKARVFFADDPQFQTLLAENSGLRLWWKTTNSLTRGMLYLFGLFLFFVLMGVIF